MTASTVLVAALLPGLVLLVGGKATLLQGKLAS
jgi:hypothetical protein